MVTTGTRENADPDLSSAEFKADPFPYFAELRANDPVHRIRLRNGNTAWLITRYDDAVAALGDSRLAKDPLKAKSGSGGKPPWLPGPLKALSRNMLDLDEPDHRRLRTLVQKAFTPRVVEGLRARLESLADDLVDRIIRRGDTFDLIRDYAAPIPVTIIAELLGVASADRARFHRWSSAIVAADTSKWRAMRALPAGMSFIMFLRKLIRERSRAPKDDLLSKLIEAQEAGDHLSADELLAMSFLLLVAGHETTVSLIGNGVLALLKNGEALARLRQEPGLLSTAIEEMLRYGSPLQLATERYAAENVTIRGATIPRGAMVYVALASANRDDAAFADAETFDIARQPNPHLAFGHGIHYCLGAPLARPEGEIAIRHLLARFTDLDLAVPEGTALATWAHTPWSRVAAGANPLESATTRGKRLSNRLMKQPLTGEEE